MSGSRVQRVVDRPGRRPALPRQPRHTYAAVLRCGLPTGVVHPASELIPPEAGSRTAHRPISARFEPAPDLRGVHHWFARATPSGLARRARTVWQSQHDPALSGLLPPYPGVPRVRLPSASIRPLRRPNGQGISPPHDNAPLHGAPPPSGRPRTPAGWGRTRPGPAGPPPGAAAVCTAPAAARAPRCWSYWVIGDRDLRDLVLLIAVDHPQIAWRRPGPGRSSQRPVGNRSRWSSGSVHARCDPRRPALLTPRPLRPTPRRCFSGAGGVCPDRHPARAGIEELPELRDSRCSTRASFAAQPSFNAGQRGDLPGLLADHDDQLLARHLLRLGHPKIALRPGRHLRDRHANIEGSDSTSRAAVTPRAK